VYFSKFELLDLHPADGGADQDRSAPRRSAERGDRRLPAASRLRVWSTAARQPRRPRRTRR